MTQYLNPDLDGDCTISSICPLRLLEQTCSNVGKDIASSPTDLVNKVVCDVKCGVKRELLSDKAESDNVPTCNKVAGATKRCAFSPVNSAAEATAEKRLRRDRDCSAQQQQQQSTGENHLLLTVATAAQQCNTSPTNVNSVNAAAQQQQQQQQQHQQQQQQQQQQRGSSLTSVNMQFDSISNGNKPQALIQSDGDRWLELRRTIMALQAALQNNSATSATVPAAAEQYSNSRQPQPLPQPQLQPQPQPAEATSNAFATLVDQNSKQFTCQWMACGMQFASVDELSKHLNVHVHAQTRMSNASSSMINSASTSSSASASAALGNTLQQVALQNMGFASPNLAASSNVSALPANIQQLLLSGGLLTPRTSLSSSNMSPVSPLSLTPPPTATSPQSPNQAAAPLLSYPNWLSLWLSRLMANAASGVNSSQAQHSAGVSNYAQLAMAGGINNMLNGLTSPNVPRELVGYPVLSPYAGGLPSGNPLSLLTNRFGSAV